MIKKDIKCIFTSYFYKVIHSFAGIAILYMHKENIIKLIFFKTIFFRLTGTFNIDRYNVFKGLDP